jgi:hypothetical protein
MREVHKSLDALSSMMSAVPRQNIILQNIFFSSMDIREETIANAEDGTFEWIFENSVAEENDSDELSGIQRTNEGLGEVQQDRRSQARTLLLNWLRSGTGVFHISGKAGAGKSTLMKFICGHGRTETELEAWAGAKRLVFARFYFWKSNDDMQMSLAGLYRAILFATLKQCPEIIPDVFPVQWEQLAPESDIPYVQGNLFSASDFLKAFELLTKKGKFPKHRFCFFIDGLDEFKGQSLDQKQLVKSLQLWTSADDVKICASSRPYLEFEKLANPPDQRIHLHELTQHDIYIFSRQMIEKDDHFARIEQSYLELVHEIVIRSEGVFLWARLVVCSLLAGMLRHDSWRDLEKKLKVLPRDINDLYDQLLNSLTPDDRERAVQMLLLTVQNPFDKPLNCVVYSWIDDLSDPQFPPLDGRKPPSWRPVSEITEAIQRQLTDLTKGMLETTPSYYGMRVRFSHRTVRDYILESLKVEEISRKNPDLLVLEKYQRLWLAEMILLDPTHRKDIWNGNVSSFVKVYFQPKLSIELFEGSRHVLEDGKNTVSDGGIFHGASRGVMVTSFGDKLSFVHLAAYTGQRAYVSRETLKHSALLHGDGKLHLLCSALSGHHLDLARDLLQQGSSPLDYVFGDTCDIPSVPIWMALTVCFVGNYIGSSVYREPYLFEMLDLFSQYKDIDASNCFFFFKAWDEPMIRVPATHFMTLKDLIQDVEPPNMNQLLTLFKKTEIVFDSDAKHTRLKASGTLIPMRLTRVVCGDISLKDVEFRTF